MTKEQPITIIKGDDFEKHISITSSKVFPEDIDKVFFSCSALEVEKELEYDKANHYYVLSFSADETRGFRVSKMFNFDFDITIKLMDTEDTSGAEAVTISGKVYTVVYRKSLVVLPKTNQVAALIPSHEEEPEGGE